MSVTALHGDRAVDDQCRSVAENKPVGLPEVRADGDLHPFRAVPKDEEREAASRRGILPANNAASSPDEAAVPNTA